MDQLTFTKLVDWCLLSILSGGVGWAALYLTKISGNIQKLNVQIARVIERIDFHQRELEAQDKRLTYVERMGVKFHGPKYSNADSN